MITLREHESSSYAPRTYHNAAQGVTLALAVDHTTAGERLTQKAASGRIVKVTVDQLVASALDAPRKLYSMMKKQNVRILNVAGNGIYTWKAHGFTQEEVNAYVYHIISTVNNHLQIEKIVSGGQTGTDLAGLVTAAKLGIPCVGTWPKGYKMRFEDGVDRNHSPTEVMEIIRAYL